MTPCRTALTWSILLTSFLLLFAGVAAMWKPLSKEYHGTIYYADHDGVWKVQLPNLERARLAAQELLDPWDLRLSPDQQWLAYIEAGRWSLGEDPDHLWAHPLWVLSTQGGTPVKVDQVEGPSYWLANNQLLYQTQDGQNPFLFDPQTGHRQLAKRWSRAFEECRTWLIPSGREEILQSCPPDGVLRGYLRVVDLEGRHPITITEPFYSDDVEWSPNGERVLFEDGQRTRDKLYIWNRRDGSLRQVLGEVSHQGYQFAGLAWSPDGRWATFVSKWDWYAVELSTGRVIPFGPIVPIDQVYRMAWSPDSRAILTPLTPAGQSAARWTGQPITIEYRLSIVGIPEGNTIVLTSGEDFPPAFTWGD